MRRARVVIFSAIITVCLTKIPAHAGPRVNKIVPLPKILKVEEETPPPQPTPEVQNLLSEEFEQADIRQCITDICGPASANYSARDALLPRLVESERFRQMWTQAFVPEIAKAVETSRDYNLQYLARIEKALSSGRPAPKKHPYFAVYAFSSLIGHVGTQVGAALTIDEKTLKIGVNEAALEEVYAKAPDALRPIMRLIFDRVYRPLMQVFSPNPFADALTVRLRARFPGESRATALQKDAFALGTRMEKVTSTLGPLLGSFDSIDVELIGRVVNGGDMSKSESKQYTTFASSLEMVAPALEGELFDALMALPVELDAAVDQVRTSKIIPSLAKKMSDRTVGENVKQVVDTCRPRLNVALGSRASDLAHRKLKDVIGEVRVAGKSVAGKLVEEKSKLLANRIIDGVKFVLPENPDVIISETKRAIRRVTDSTRDGLENLKSESEKIDDDLMMVSLTIAQAGLSNNGDSLVKLCEKFPDSTAGDFAVTALGKIRLSWYTAVYRDFGVGIIAHELGHVVSAGLRAIGKASGAPQFLESLSCVANRNPFVVQPVQLSYAENTLSSEEDWADRFSSAVIMELRKTPGSWGSLSRNYACALVVDDGDQYGFNSMFPVQGDKHSSGFLRSLMVAQDTGTLPKTCEKFLSFAPSNNRALMCR